MEQDIFNLNKQRRTVIKWIGKKTLFDNARNSSDNTPQDRFFQLSNVIYRASVPRATESNKALVTNNSVEKRAYDYHRVCSAGCKTVRFGKYICNYCGKTFQWCSHWLAHERIHTGERPFKCEICNKAFTRSDGLKCHKMTHKHEKRKTSCIEKSPTTPIYTTHAIARQNYDDESRGSRRLKCEKCNRVFNRPSALDIHSRVHTGVKPYPCNICTKSFSIYGNLRRHLLIHTGERPYTCSKCSISFNNSSHLKRHIKNKHQVRCFGNRM